MNIRHLTNIQKLTISGMVMALYITVLYATQSVSFGPYQIRIATSLYALSYYFPFLILPMGIANLISNLLFGGLGILDMLGGCAVGIVTAFLITCIRRMELPVWACAVPIVVVPGFGVAIWLSWILSLPYLPLVVSLCIGQSAPAACGVMLIGALYRIFNRREAAA